MFFRSYARDEANRLKLSGWVRNNRDGTVECFAQGPNDPIEVFIQFLNKGSPYSKVDGVEVRDEQPNPEIKDFRIIY